MVRDRKPDGAGTETDPNHGWFLAQLRGTEVPHPSEPASEMPPAPASESPAAPAASAPRSGRASAPLATPSSSRQPRSTRPRPVSAGQSLAAGPSSAKSALPRVEEIPERADPPGIPEQAGAHDQSAKPGEADAAPNGSSGNGSTSQRSRRPATPRNAELRRAHQTVVAPTARVPARAPRAASDPRVIRPVAGQPGIARQPASRPAVARPAPSRAGAVRPVGRRPAAPPVPSETAAPPARSEAAVPPARSETVAPPVPSETAAPPVPSETAEPPARSEAAAPPAPTKTPPPRVARVPVTASAVASVVSPTRHEYPGARARTRRWMRGFAPRLVALAAIVLLAVGGAIAVFSVTSSSQAEQPASTVPEENVDPVPRPDEPTPAPRPDEPTPAPRPDAPTPAPTQTPELVIPPQP